MRFILAYFKILVWFDPGIVRLCVCVYIWRKDRMGDLRRESKVDSSESYSTSEVLQVKKQRKEWLNIEK